MADPFAALALRLAEAAQALRQARAEDLRLARTDPAARWRRAALLWPRFTKD